MALFVPNYWHMAEKDVNLGLHDIPILGCCLLVLSDQKETPVGKCQPQSAVGVVHNEEEYNTCVVYGDRIICEDRLVWGRCVKTLPMSRKLLVPN